jgi:hypothetical protein
MKSLNKTPISNKIAALAPLRMLVSSRMKNTGPTIILNKKPVTIPFKIKSNKTYRLVYLQK